MHSFTFAVNRLFCEPDDPLDEFDPYDWEFWDEVEAQYERICEQFGDTFDRFEMALEYVQDLHWHPSRAIHTSIGDTIECSCGDEDDEWYIPKLNLFAHGPGTTFMPGITMDYALECMWLPSDYHEQDSVQVTSDTYAHEDFEYTG